MPEIVEEVKKIDCQDLIIDGEALTYDENTNVLYPFQITIQRKRKHNVEEISQELPLRLFVFDIMLFNKKNMINEPYTKRRELLDKLFSNTKTISKTKMIITDNEKDIDKFFDLTIEQGLEGIVAKRLDSPYSAGLISTFISFSILKSCLNCSSEKPEPTFMNLCPETI